MVKRFELEAGKRQSFYGKCYVEQDGNTCTLYSYHSRVMAINVVTRDVWKYSAYNYSQTTRRHQKAFCEFYDITEEELKNAY